jgi:hypothetical protein
MLGEQVEELSVDGNTISENQYADYDDILAEGKNYLIGNSRSHPKRAAVNLINFFDAQLRADHILAAETHYHFELSSNSFPLTMSSRVKLFSRSTRTFMKHVRAR